MAYTSNERRLAVEYLRLLKRQRAITTAEYNRRKAIIDRREAKAVAAANARAVRQAEAREEKRLAAEGASMMRKMLRDSKNEYLVTINTTKSSSVRQLRGKNNKKLKNPVILRRIPDSEFSKSVKVVRRPGESMKQFKKRIDDLVKEEVRQLNANMYDVEGAGDATTDTMIVYTSTSHSIQQTGVSTRGMTRAKPYAYEFEAYASIVDDGNCVPESLHKLYPKYDLNDIVKSMGGEGPKTCEQVLEWCKKRDITCLGTDDEFNVLVEYRSRNRNHKPLYFVEKDNHFYLMDKVQGMSLSNSRANSFTVKKSEKAPVVQEVVMVEEADEVLYKEANKHYIVKSAGILKIVLHDYIQTTHSIPQVHFACLNSRTVFINSFNFGNNCKVSISKNYEVVKSLAGAVKSDKMTMLSIVETIKKSLDISIPKSCMNSTVFSIFREWKSRQHYANLMKPEDWERVPGIEQTWDANKQYTSALMNMPCDWMVFNMFSLPAPYSGGVKNAMYYIETRNAMPCRGNGWYSRLILEWLINNAEADSYKVKYEIVAESTVKRDIFVPFVKKAMTLCPTKFKFITNTLCGSLNTHSVKVAKGHISANKNQEIGRCMSSDAHFLQLTEEVFASASINVKYEAENNMPMYSQIIDYGAIKLADAIKHLKAKGCAIRGYNTDSVTFKHSTVLDIDLPTSKIGGWKAENVKPYAHQANPIVRADRYVFKKPSWLTTMTEDDFEDVDKIVDHIVSKNESLSIDGAAGYGKSYLLDKFIERVGADACCVLGFTNISANNIGGKTFHNTFKIEVATGAAKYDPRTILKDKKWLIIDEKSQVPTALYRICQIANEMNIPVIMAGDFMQITPVGESGVNSMNDSYIKLICKNLLTLTKYKRGDMELLKALISVRDRIPILDFDQEEKGQLHFCFTKAKRDFINVREMSKRTGIDMPKNSSISKIYVGLPLRSSETKENGDWLNNERWVISDITREDYEYSVTVSNERMRHTVNLDVLLESFVPGYAMTIHSSQGLTITEDYTVWLETQTAFSDDEKWRLIYTALSRATSKKQIGLMMV